MFANYQLTYRLGAPLLVSSFACGSLRAGSWGGSIIGIGYQHPTFRNHGQKTMGKHAFESSKPWAGPGQLSTKKIA